MKRYKAEHIEMSLRRIGVRDAEIGGPAYSTALGASRQRPRDRSLLDDEPCVQPRR